MKQEEEASKKAVRDITRISHFVTAICRLIQQFPWRNVCGCICYFAAANYR